MRITLCAVLLSGCAGLANPNLTPEQIKAMVADKASTAVCITIVTPGGVSKAVYVNLDETKVNGTVNIDSASCGVNMTTTTPAKVTPTPVPTTAPTSAPTPQ